MLRAVPPALADCPKLNRIDNTHPNYHVVQHRLLETFGRRESASPFIFEFNTKDHALQYWLRLYAAPIRCAVETRDDNFLFVTWQDRNYQASEDWAHATVFYFDNRPQQQQQVFIDPSFACNRTGSGDMLRHFTKQHLWQPEGKAFTVDADLSCEHPSENLQQYFCSSGVSCDLSGCCTTMCILVVLVSLRFGSRLSFKRPQCIKTQS